MHLGNLLGGGGGERERVPSLAQWVGGDRTSIANPRARPELADLEGICIMELSGCGYDTCFEMSDVLIGPHLSMIGEGGAPIV